MPWGQSTYLQQQATASANKSKEKKKKSVPSGYSGSTTFTSSSAAGGQASQTQAGIDHVANTLGLSDGEATALEGKDKKFYETNKVGDATVTVKDTTGSTISSFPYKGRAVRLFVEGTATQSLDSVGIVFRSYLKLFDNVSSS